MARKGAAISYRKCKHVGKRAGNRDGVATFYCGVLGRCTRSIPVDGLQCCAECCQAETADGEPIPVSRTRATASCGHRGGVKRRQVCKSCAGAVRIKVMGCDLHGECTIGKQLDGLACCRACSDFMEGGDK